MKFMITFNHVDGVWDRQTPAQRERHGQELKELQEALAAEKGTELVFLYPVESAKTVRLHEDGRMEVSDGPYRTSPEQPGGYYIIDADSMEEAVEWARKGRFLVGSNQVRQIFEGTI